MSNSTEASEEAQRQELRLPSTQKVLSNLNDLIEVQRDNINDSYMQGLYNGLVLVKSLITNEEPIFKHETFIDGEAVDLFGELDYSLIHPKIEKCENCKYYRYLQEEAVSLCMNDDNKQDFDSKFMEITSDFSCNKWAKND